MTRTKTSAEARLSRLLVLVPWVANEDGPTVEEVCERFNMTEKELASDLSLLFLCGLYPFTPDSLIEADIVDGRVWIRFSEAFVRPPTFTRTEALSIVAAATAIAELPEGNTPALQSALSKLLLALGLDDPDVVDVKLAPAPNDVLQQVRNASESHNVIEVDYYSYGRDSWARRMIEPVRVFNQQGQWYLQGHDHNGNHDQAKPSDELKVFRIDRMREVWILDQQFEAVVNLDKPAVYTPRADDASATLELAPQDFWICEQYRIENLNELPNGNREVTLMISETAWLERLLLRLSENSRLISGEIDLKATSQRLLRNYGEQ